MPHSGIKRRPKDHVSGSGRTVKLTSDLGSAVVDELVEQLNAAESQITKSLFNAANGATTREPLAHFRYDVLIKDFALHNIDATAIDNAATDIRFAYRAQTDKNMSGAGTPLPAGGGALFVEGFTGATLAAGTSAWADEFEAGVLGTAITVPWGGPFILPAGNLLYFEVVNTEGAVFDFGVSVTYALCDKLSLQPRNIQNKVFQAVRLNRRGDRSSVL